MEGLESRECLLDKQHYVDEKEIPSCSLSSPVRPESFRRCFSYVYFCLLHCIVLIFFMVHFQPHESWVSHRSIYQPFSHELASIDRNRTRVEIPDHDRTGGYEGPPTKENNEAWDNLMERLYLNVSETEIRNVAMSSQIEDLAQAADGGYFASVEVFHLLHCLRQLRMWVYNDHFYPSSAGFVTEDLQSHLGHCVENLRQYLMCNAPLSLNLFTWKTNVPVSSFTNFIKPVNTIAQARTCIHWDTLEEWADSRHATLTPLVLVPTDLHG